jgi:isopropylmalate/homocitrate/citramalate synthase
LLGIGERTGNIPLEAMVFEYAALRGSMDGMDPTVITEIAEYFHKDIGYDIPVMTPFVGRSFNSTRAGIHADGLLKDQEIYSIFDTEKLLNRPATVQISKTSGLAGIAYWINVHYGLKGDRELKKNAPRAAAIKNGPTACTRTDGRRLCPTVSWNRKLRNWHPADFKEEVWRSLRQFP